MSDRAAVMTTAILLTLRRALEEARPALEAFLRDEIEDIRREAFREAAELNDRNQYD